MVTWWMSPQVSVPILRAEEWERRMQFEIRMFEQSPYFFVMGAVVFTTMASSAQVMMQPRMITFRQQSGSMPSLFGPRSLFSMRTPSIRTSRQPAIWRVQKAAS